MGSLLRRTIDRFTTPASYDGPKRPQKAAADVIVIDDSLGLQNVVGQIVAKSGLKPDFASSLDQVIRLELGGCDSLVLLDLALERSDAFDVLKHLSEIGFRGPIIPMSGQERTILEFVGSFGRQLQLEMLPALCKPFKADQLRLIVAEHVQRRSQPIKIDLSATLEQRRLEVWYQPRIDLRTFRMSGFEASVRIKHPTEGILPPERFMSELTDAETAILTTQVCRQTIECWEQLARSNVILRPCIRVRAQEVLDPELIETLKHSRPKDTRWPGMVMAFADSKLLSESDAARQALVRLRIHQVKIALDDVTAVSGMIDFPELRVSEIRLGKRFVVGCSHDSERLAICREIIAFANRSQTRIVAEGIETSEDMNVIKSFGVNFAQGSLFSPAIPFEALDRLQQKSEPLWGRDA